MATAIGNSGNPRNLKPDNRCRIERTTRAAPAALNHLPHDLDFRVVKIWLPLGVLEWRDDLLAWRVDATRGEAQLKNARTTSCAAQRRCKQWPC